MTPDFYYLESDGQVFLINEGVFWRFPKSRRQIPCPFKPVFTMSLPRGRVLFAKPVLRRHPEHWFHKDDLIGRPDVDPLVQQAVYRTLPRNASKVAIVEMGKVLMVRASRGLTLGIWNLPGGFASYGEHPARCAVRETFEELGVRVKLQRLLGVYSETFAKTGDSMVSFVYLGKRLNRTIRPEPDEIETFCWMPLRKALRATLNPFAKAGLRDYLRSNGLARCPSDLS
jgi:ADP-ribose pyrophosphatase YjhB (NUDIX family)